MLDKRLKFTAYTREFLDKSWGWLNDPEIKNLTSTPDFTKAQQEEFFSKLPRQNYYIWGLDYNSKKIGVVGLKNVKQNSAEYFGYIGDKTYWGQGLFESILKLIKLECKKSRIFEIYLYVSVENVRAIKAYMKNGFNIVSSLSTDEMIYMNTRVD